MVLLKQVYKQNHKENSYSSLVSTFYLSLIDTSREIVKTRTAKVKNIQRNKIQMKYLEDMSADITVTEINIYMTVEIVKYMLYNAV